MVSLGFVAPAMLGLLASAALILWLHSVRPERRIVPSMMIWLSLPDLPGAAKRRRWLPKLSALLLLQLAALIALVLALAQPFFGAPPPNHLVLVIDGSGTMRATAGDRTGFDLARTDLVHHMHDLKDAPPERLSLILAGPEPRLIAARLAYEPEALTPLLDQLSASDGPADWNGVAGLVRQTLDPDETTAGMIVGGAVSEVSSLDETLPFVFTHLPVALPALAPRLDVRLSPLDEQTWALRGTLIADPALTRAVVDIGFTLESDIGTRPPLPWASLALDLEAGQAQIDQTLTLPEPGLISVGAGAEDRQVWPGAIARFLTLPQPAHRVLYIAPSGTPDQPLVRAIMAQEGIDVFQADGLPPDHDGFALVIVDGITLPQAPAAPTVWIGIAGSGEDDTGTVSVADADFWHPFHPLTRSGDWRRPGFGPISTRPLAQDSEVLLSGANYPLMAVSRRGPFQDIDLRFDPRAVDWNNGDTLPVLATAITDWLGLTGASRGNCQVGLSCAGGTGVFVGVENNDRFTTETDVFTPMISGLFRDGSGSLLAINAAPDRFGHRQADSAQPLTDASPMGLAWVLIVAAALLLLADAALRFRISGRRAWPACLAIVLVGSALAGLPFPLPFERSVRVHLAAEGDVAQATDPSVLAGPAPRILTDGLRREPVAIPEARLAEPRATAITHVSEAIALAAAMVPPYQTADIVADLAVRAPVPTTSGERVLLPAHAHLQSVFSPDRTNAGPVLTAIALPADAVPGDRLELTALVEAAIEVPVQIAFHANGTQLAVEDATLDSGMNRIEVDLPPLGEGETLFTVTVTTPGAPTSTLSAIVMARAGRPILVLSPDRAHGEAFVQMASAAVPGLSGLSQPDMTILDPSLAPDYLRDWLAYDSIVLLNMPARAVTSREAGLIEAAVTGHGLGLVILGGSDAFGPGGYYATQFEALSPLSARVPRDAPEVTMVFVLDRSGSMNQPVAGGTRLEMARQATQEAIGLLNPESQVGIVVFDAEARTVLGLTRAGDAEAVRAALAGVDTGGGTSIAPGMEAGWAMLRGSDAQARHMIVMTDGLSTPGDFASMAGQMRDQGITVSAVAVGTGADTRAVTAIAAAGGGSVHASDDFATLPSILSQEAMLLSSPVREGPGQVMVEDRSDPLLAGLPAALPPIDGVVLTTAKPEADIALSTTTPDGENTPLLATWRHGHGSVLAFASDVTGPWTRRWQADPDLAPLWPHVLRQIRPVRPASGPWLSLQDLGETMQLTLEALDPDGAPRQGLAVIASVDENGRPFDLPMREIGPGTYRAVFAPQSTGRITAQVTLAGPSGPQSVGRPQPDEVAQTSFFHARPYWAAPLVGQPLLVAGGAASVPEGWGVRLVAGLSTPWLVLALIVFLATLFFYMRPPRSAFRRSADSPSARSNQGMAL